MILATDPPIEIPLESMSLADKLALKQALDQDLQTTCQTGAPQDWHFKVLAERETRLASGEAHLMELDDFITAMRQAMP
jgi:hypothetical protein